MKNVQAVKNSLKFKAVPKSGLLTVRVGVKKYVLPVEARMIAGDGYLFLSFGSSSEIYKADGKGLVALEPTAEAEEAAAALTPKASRRRRRNREKAAMPSELEAALKAVPAGHKLVLGPGGYRLVKTRERRKK